MVTDLQGMFKRGNEYILTDPAICCIDGKRFSRTNTGNDGMRRFFQSHQCNQVCKKLKLRRSPYQTQPDRGFDQDSMIQPDYFSY
jgi:hypothetical protein